MNKKQLIVGCLIAANFIFINVALSQPDLRVEGVFIDREKESFAIVNGEIVKKGDKIDATEVIEIGEKCVKFKYGNENFVKTLEEKINNSVQETKNNEKQQIGFGAYDGIKHYEKAIELYKLGNKDEALEEAKLSLKYDYVTKEMKSKLNSIIAKVTEYQENYRKSNEKSYCFNKANEYIEKANKSKSRDEAIVYLNGAISYYFSALNSVNNEQEKRAIENTIKFLGERIENYDRPESHRWHLFGR